MRIHCDHCGGTWEIYSRDDWNDDRGRQCPHCFEHISRQVWTKEILPAFGAFLDSNKELIKDSTGYHRPLYGVDFISDNVRSERDRREALFETFNIGG